MSPLLQAEMFAIRYHLPVFKAESLSTISVNKFNLIYNNELISLTWNLTGNFELCLENLKEIITYRD
jgi:hypothetical protein